MRRAASTAGSLTVQARLALGAFVVGAAALRLACFGVLTDDVAYWVIPWYDFVRDHGIRALGRPFPNAGGWDASGNYPPPYHYLLYIATWFDGLVPTLYLIKGISVVFDGVAAGFMMAIVRLHTTEARRAWTAGLVLLFAPTVVANGALWGQCDSIFASLTLGSTYYALRGRPIAMAVLLGSALAFKGQAVFLLPFALLLVTRSVIPLWSVALIPATYLVMMLPAAFLGRPIAELLTVYLHQAAFFQRLSMNAPNLYYFLPTADVRLWTRIGVGVTVVAALVFALLPWRRRVIPTLDFLLLGATVSVAAAPFLLPRMHDRYFFTADLMSIALAFYRPRLWFVAVGFQVSSLLAYVPIISDTLNHGAGEYRGLMPVAVTINVLLISVLVAAYGRALAAPRVAA